MKTMFNLRAQSLVIIFVFKFIDNFVRNEEKNG